MSQTPEVMRVRITDKEILQSIPPAWIQTYLHSRDAEKVKEVPDKTAIWKYGGAELLVPLATHFADYAMRMMDLLSELERTENRSQLAILADICNSA